MIKARAALLGGLSALASLALAVPAQAAINVTSPADSGPGSLRQAIADAPSGETITVPAGDYQVSSAPLLIQKNLTITGAGSGTTKVRSVGPFRVFTIEPTEMVKLNVAITGIEIRDGREFEYPTGMGAGIRSTNTNLTLRDVIVTGNIVSANGEAVAEKGGNAFGGGLAVIAGALTLVESQVSGNIAEAKGGPGAPGGIAQAGGILVLGGSYTIEKSTISGNVIDASGGQGPADEKQDGGTVAGGGIGASAEEPGGSGTIVASTISGNTVRSLPGPGGDPGATAIGGGAFIAVRKTQPVGIANTTIAQNTVSAGPSAEPAPVLGGGLAVVTEGATTTITSTTIAGNAVQTTNSQGLGGNLLAAGNPGTIVIRNSIVSAGAAAAGSENCSQLPAAGALVSQGFNLESADQCGFKTPGDKVNTNPLLLPLQSFGGPTQTMAPAAGSPIVDQGAAFGLTADQHGAPRPIDLPTIPNSSVPGADGSDIGAYELQPPNALTVGKPKKNKKKGTATLQVTLTAPTAGTLTLAGKGLKPQKRAIAGQTKVTLKVIGTGKVKKALKKKGKRKVSINVTYTPTGNSAATKTVKTKLIKKLKKKKKAKKAVK